MIWKWIAVAAILVSEVSTESRSYPVRLTNYGPSATNVPIVNSHVQTRIMERVPLRTLGCIPQPKTISNTCTCVKTVVKPQVHNQIISVPSVQRIIQTTATPVIEKIHYPATPVEPSVGPVPSILYPGLSAFGGLQSGIVTPGCSPFVSMPVPIVPSCTCASKALIL